MLKHNPQTDLTEEVSRLSKIFCSEKRTPEFCHLLSKSLPRSGHHFLEKTLKRLYGKSFDYCEYYQPSETECCKQQPCLKFCNPDRMRDGTQHVSMQKSHDFELGDRIYAPSEWLKYVILVRDYKPAMSSDIKLLLIGHFAEFLSGHQIDSTRIFMHHDKELYRQALALIDEHGLKVPHETIEFFLYQRYWLHKNFRDKWGRVTREHPHGGILLDFKELTGEKRKHIVSNIVTMIGLPTEISVEEALIREPVLPKSKKETERSLLTNYLLEENKHIIKHYAALLEEATPITDGWRWV